MMTDREQKLFRDLSIALAPYYTGALIVREVDGKVVPVGRSGHVSHYKGLELAEETEKKSLLGNKLRRNFIFGAYEKSNDSGVAELMFEGPTVPSDKAHEAFRLVLSRYC